MISYLIFFGLNLRASLMAIGCEPNDLRFAGDKLISRR
jgi:hypothetical protein